MMANKIGKIKLEDIMKQAGVYNTAFIVVNKLDYSCRPYNRSDDLSGMGTPNAQQLQPDNPENKWNVLSDFQKKRLKLNKLVKDFLENSSKYQLSTEDFTTLKSAIPTLPDQEIYGRERGHGYDPHEHRMHYMLVNLGVPMREEQVVLSEAIGKIEKNYKQLDTVIQDIRSNLENKYLSEKRFNFNSKRVVKIKEITRELLEISNITDPEKKANVTRGCLLKSPIQH